MLDYICNADQNVISLISALIGGGLTLLGVICTLKAQKKEEFNSRKLEVKPWLFSFDERQDYDPTGMVSYRMEVGGTYHSGTNSYFTGVIKNTDNGIALLDRVETKNNTYYPSCGNVIDKNALFILRIVLADGTENLKDMYLYVKDVYGNSYRYELFQNGNKFKLGICEDVK